MPAITLQTRWISHFNSSHRRSTYTSASFCPANSCESLGFKWKMTVSHCTCTAFRGVIHCDSKQLLQCEIQFRHAAFRWSRSYHRTGLHTMHVLKPTIFGICVNTSGFYLHVAYLIIHRWPRWKSNGRAKSMSRWIIVPEIKRKCSISVLMKGIVRDLRNFPIRKNYANPVKRTEKWTARIQCGQHWLAGSTCFRSHAIMTHCIYHHLRIYHALAQCPHCICICNIPTETKGILHRDKFSFIRIGTIVLIS